MKLLESHGAQSDSSYNKNLQKCSNKSLFFKDKKSTTNIKNQIYYNDELQQSPDFRGIERQDSFNREEEEKKVLENFNNPHLDDDPKDFQSRFMRKADALLENCSLSKSLPRPKKGSQFARIQEKR